MLLSLHTLGAAFAKAPEFAIDKTEAKMLAEAVDAVQQHYDFDVSPAAQLWINLASVLALVYGPRIMAVTARKTNEKKAKAAAAAQSTLHVVPNNHAPAR